MRKLILTLTICLTALFSQAQQWDKPTKDFAQYSQNATNHIIASFDKKDYTDVADTINDWFKRYHALPADMQKNLAVFTISMNYNMACVCSRQGKINEGLDWFDRSLAAGYIDYANVSTDHDMDNLRSSERFQDALQKLREKYDYSYVLQHSGPYNNKQANLPAFTYQPATAPELVALRSKYNLDSVAGNGDEISKMKKLLYWVHNEVRHDGNSFNPPSRNAVDLITVCQKENRGVNCRMMATILRDVYQSEGMPTRIVTCMPKDSADNDCHVITVVWSKSQNKWLWMDPTFNAYVTDSKGNLLNIAEVRERLFNGNMDDLVVNDDANWNNKNKETKAAYLGYYMSKNLYWLKCSIKSEWDIETYKPGKESVDYIDLFPGSYNRIHADKKVFKTSTEYATNNPDYFWQQPAIG
ncbi:MAG: TPR end-of-group domain-containing protein, partial [Mucilaginibacter sp.]